MSLLGIDLGATKLAVAVFTKEGKILHKENIPLQNRQGNGVGDLVSGCYQELSQSDKYGAIEAVGIAVPGIYQAASGTVWAPNIPGWQQYPLLQEMKALNENLPVAIDSDRACYILGEAWQGNAKLHKHAIYMAVGTGIGAGILVNGQVLRGAHDVAGAIGWMALKQPFNDEYMHCGCFEHYASGEGIAKMARRLLKKTDAVPGAAFLKPLSTITAHDVFEAWHNREPIAVEVIQTCIDFWGMAAANLVSLFNPEKIIFGGGVFGPAIPLIPLIKTAASQWAQPVSMKQVVFSSSALDGDAGVYGAGWLALKSLADKQQAV